MNTNTEQLPMPPAVQAAVDRALESEFRRHWRARRSNPTRHKLSTLMENPAYRYLEAGTDGRGRAVWFCWSCDRNVAGYYLGWRELRGKSGVTRDRWIARRGRSCQEFARHRAARFRKAQRG